MKESPDDVELDGRLRVMLVFARRLTKNSRNIRREDLASLREAGLDDATIVDLVSVVSYFNFINRVAQGLGVYLDEPLRPCADPDDLRRELERLEEGA